MKHCIYVTILQPIVILDLSALVTAFINYLFIFIIYLLLFIIY
jgi:hypothetical protein